jgi:hypothetical protein
MRRPLQSSQRLGPLPWRRTEPSPTDQEGDSSEPTAIEIHEHFSKQEHDVKPTPPAAAEDAVEDDIEDEYPLSDAEDLWAATVQPYRPLQESLGRQLFTRHYNARSPSLHTNINTTATQA